MIGKIIRGFIKALFIFELIALVSHINIPTADAKEKKFGFRADAAYMLENDCIVSSLRNIKGIINTEFKSTDLSIVKVKKISNYKVKYFSTTNFGWVDIVATSKIKTKTGKIVTKKARLNVCVSPSNEYMEAQEQGNNQETESIVVKDGYIELPEIPSLEGKDLNERIEYLRGVFKEGTKWGAEKKYMWEASTNNKDTHACGAFAAIMSDLVYGKDAGIETIGFPSFSDIQVGDVVSVVFPGEFPSDGVFRNTHAIFVIDRDEDTITYVNGNDGGLVRWDCKDDENGWFYLYIQRRI